MNRRYEPNPKHKRGACGNGPPRWYPTRDALCPDGLDMDTTQELLASAVEGSDATFRDGKALYNYHEGQFYKAYPHGTEGHGGETVVVWHGYPVRPELVRTQVPAQVLRKFVATGRLTNAEYKRYLGSAR